MQGMIGKQQRRGGTFSLSYAAKPVESRWKAMIPAPASFIAAKESGLWNSQGNQSLWGA